MYDANLVVLAIATIFNLEVHAKVTPARLKDFGFMVVVYDDSKKPAMYCCSGVLVTNKIVMTTCQCIGTFSYDSSLNLVFTPINWLTYIVEIGFDGRGSKPLYSRIEEVKPYDKCAFHKISYFIHNLGTITLTNEVDVSGTSLVTVAPKLLESTQDKMEERVLEMIYNEEHCTIVGFGSQLKILQLQTTRTRFIPFLKCSGRICFNPNECLKNVDIANNEEMCASAKNGSDNCAADEGSPILCDSHLTGFVKYVSCNASIANATDPVPVLLTRLGGAVDYYKSITGVSARPLPLRKPSITLFVLEVVLTLNNK